MRENLGIWDLFVFLYTVYVTINLGEVYITDDIREKSFGVDGYLDETLAELKKECEQ